ncbi:hypothetical protein BDZ89DRAFT_398350 [Hymenopellis radicata]|nr:hypothetical protein BDZ89DRAFT_398350 [Hymenopellis radicata]
MSAKPIYSSDVEVAIVHDEDWITELGETTDSESDGFSSRGPLSISKEPVVVDGVGYLKERPVAGSAPKGLALFKSVHDSPLDFESTHGGASTFRLTDGSPVYPPFMLKAGTIYLRPVIPLPNQVEQLLPLRHQSLPRVRPPLTLHLLRDLPKRKLKPSLLRNPIVVPRKCFPRRIRNPLLFPRDLPITNVPTKRMHHLRPHLVPHHHL